MVRLNSLFVEALAGAAFYSAFFVFWMIAPWVAAFSAAFEHCLA